MVRTIRKPEDERVLIVLLLVLVLSREKIGQEPDIDGFCQILDRAISLLELHDPEIRKELGLVSPVVENFVRKILSLYDNLIRLTASHGQTLIRFRPNTGQGVRQILRTFDVDQAWKFEVEQTCEKARQWYRSDVERLD